MRWLNNLQVTDTSTQTDNTWHAYTNCIKQRNSVHNVFGMAIKAIIFDDFEHQIYEYNNSNKNNKLQDILKMKYNSNNYNQMYYLLDKKELLYICLSVCLPVYYGSVQEKILVSYGWCDDDDYNDDGPCIYIH